MTEWLSTIGDLFMTFMRVGVSGFGGGQALVPLIQNEVVERHGWLNSHEFTDVLAIGNAFPGPITTKLATYIGYKQAGVLGSLISLVGLILPTALAMLLLGGLLIKYRDSPRIAGMLKVVRPAMIGMLVVMAFSLGRDILVDPFSYAVTIVAVILIGAFRLHPGMVMIGAAAAGLVFLR